MYWHVSLKEFLADVNNSSLHDEVAALMCFFLLRVVFTSLSYDLFWRTRILRAFATYTVAVIPLQPPPCRVTE